jgi:hypothetical protein
MFKLCVSAHGLCLSLPAYKAEHSAELGRTCITHIVFDHMTDMLSDAKNDSSICTADFLNKNNKMMRMK